MLYLTCITEVEEKAGLSRGIKLLFPTLFEYIIYPTHFNKILPIRFLVWISYDANLEVFNQCEKRQKEMRVKKISKMTLYKKIYLAILLLCSIYIPRTS